MQMKTELAEQHVADLRRAAGSHVEVDFPQPQPVEAPARPRPRPWVLYRRLLVRWGLVVPPAPEGRICA